MTKVAVIVGAGDAIGSAVGRRFAKGGYTVCLVRRSAEKAAPHIAARSPPALNRWTTGGTG